MKNSIIYFVVLLLLFSNCTTTDKDADKAEAVAAIDGFYKAITKFDYESMRTYCTDDFSGIEDGKIYNNLDEFIEELKTIEGSNIENDYKVQKAFIDLKSVLLVIEINAVITMNNEEKIIIKGIENYYLVKENGKWLIRFYHTTYLNE